MRVLTHAEIMASAEKGKRNPASLSREEVRALCLFLGPSPSSDRRPQPLETKSHG